MRFQGLISRLKVLSLGFGFGDLPHESKGVPGLVDENLRGHADPQM